ncbi:MAG: hypothetical protein IKV73_01480, partial [Clostridia bacterium]|nr:hypothetical protein [Clostridia bacterium]
MLKRTIVIFLVISLALTFPAANSFAAQTLCELIGIGDLSANKIIILDGAEGTSAQKTVTNTQIINLGDSIGVFSNPWNTDYRISGDSLRSAILNSTDLNLSDEAASTSEGYNIKYISPMEVGDGTQTVDGGVVRAEKDGAAIDVPIVTSKVLASYDGSHIGTDWSNAPSGTSLKRNVTGLAGKLVNDNAFQFTVNAGTTLKSSNPARADTRGIDTLNTPKTVVTVEFEIRVTGDAVGLVERNSGYSLMKLSADGILSYKSYDDNAIIDVQVCSDASQWHDVAITYDYAADRIIYYFDGEMLPKTGNAISGADLTEIRFGLDNITYTTGGTVCVDNLYINRGYYNPAASDNPIKTACKNGTLTASYYSPSGDRVLILALYDGNTLADIAFKPISEPGQYLVDLPYTPGSSYKAFVRESDFVKPIGCFEGITDKFKSGNRVIMNCDFESSFPLSYHKNGSIIETTREDDGNTAVLFERSGVGDFHLNALSLNAQADCVAIEFGLKVLDPESMVNLMLQDADGVTYCYARLLSGGSLLLGKSEVSLNTNTWYRVSAIVNTYDLTIEYYLDGIKQGTGKIDERFAAASRLNHFRIHVPPASSVSANPVKFLVDNLRIYEGTQLREELGDVRNEIVLTGKTVFPSEEEITQKLDGYFAVHTISGVAFANGEKTALENRPYEKDGNTYVNAAELASVFGIDGDFSDDVTVEDFAVASGLTLTGIPNSINDGLYIFGNDSFKIPDNEEVDKLND